MAINVCSECGGKVSSNASACPHCGNRLGRRSLQQLKVGCMALLILFGAFVVMVMIGGALIRAH